MNTGNGQDQSPVVSPVHPLKDKSTGELIRGVISDARSLMSDEARAMRLDLKKEVDLWRKALAYAAIGGTAVILGCFILLLGVARWLSVATDLPLWITYGILGLLFALGGGAVVLFGARRTQRAVDDVVEIGKQPLEDVSWITNAAKSTGR